MKTDIYAFYKWRFDRETVARTIAAHYPSYEAFAHVLEVHHSQVAKWLFADSKPSPPMLVRICEHFRCSIDAIAPRLDAVPLTPPKPTSARFFQKGRA
jgi:transcriptional regulator with XRE-family HTH domain